MPRSDYIYRFISSVWDGLPRQDRNRFSELWKGQEQIWADVLQKFYELDQSISITNIPVFLTTRWNEYAFDSDTQVLEKAQFTSFRDISRGVNLSEQYLLNLSVDHGEPIEVDCRGRNPENTQINEIIFAINQAFGFNFARGAFQNTTIELTGQIAGPNGSIRIDVPDDVARDATNIILGLEDFEVPLVTPRNPYKYSLPDPKIMSIPSLQDAIRTESLEYYVIEDADYQVDRSRSIISFREEPPEILWAKVTRINENTPFYNFGWLIDYGDDTVTEEAYLENVQGLWFAFWQGPKPELIRRALYLLFGLPVSTRNGIVISRGEQLMEILHDDNVVRTYVLPSQLQWLVAVGEYVERFQPLVTGIDVFDKVNLPGFVQTEIGRDALQQFALPEATRGTSPETDESKALVAMEEHTFLPQINVNAFVRPNINVGNIFSFLRNIKPLHKDFYFQVIVAIFTEELDLQDISGFSFDLDVTPNLDSNQVTDTTEQTRLDYEEQDIPALDLDSDTLGIFERGSLTFEDNSGPLPQDGVVFD